MLERRFRYTVEGSAQVPLVSVHSEQGRWVATVMLANAVETLHRTEGHDRIDEAITAAERFIFERYRSFVMVRVSED